MLPLRSNSEARVCLVLVGVRSDNLADMRLRVWKKTMAVRVFRSAKIGNFGGLFFQIVHLFRLGSNGFL